MMSQISNTPSNKPRQYKGKKKSLLPRNTSWVILAAPFFFRGGSRSALGLMLKPMREGVDGLKPW